MVEKKICWPTPLCGHYILTMLTGRASNQYEQEENDSEIK